MIETQNLFTTDALVRLITTLGVITSLPSITLSIYQAYRGKRVQQDRLKAANEEKFQNALKSDDISVVGRYLDSTLGSFTISEYAASKEVASKVDLLLHRISNFIGTTDEIAKMGPITDEKIGSILSLGKDTGHPGLNFELKRIRDELERGETWNALARLRRHIEITLRAIAKQRDLGGTELNSAGGLLRILEKKDFINPDAAKMLKYAVDKCNRAIHGFDITYEEALDAVGEASQAFVILYHAQE